MALIILQIDRIIEVSNFNSENTLIQLKKELGNANEIPGSDPSIEEVCFANYDPEISRLSTSFPQLHLVFGNDQKISLNPENYLYRVINQSTNPLSNYIIYNE